jgi:hypothetical protein
LPQASVIGTSTIHPPSGWVRESAAAPTRVDLVMVGRRL